MIIDIPEPPNPADALRAQTSSVYAPPPGSPSVEPPAYENHETPNRPLIEKYRVEATHSQTSTSQEAGAPTPATPEVSSISTPRTASIPPPSFSRAPPSQCSYPPFPPTYLISTGSSLDKGFPLLPPPSNAQPHPFVSHDVNEEDWARYVFSEILPVLQFVNLNTLK
jgi:Domain of unknown function (DUF4646)